MISSMMSPGETQLDSLREKSRGKFKEFIWDQLTVFAAYTLAVFGLLAAGEQFLKYSDAHCFVFTNFNRDQAAFVNSYCTRRVRKMEQLSLLFFLETLFVGGPHVLWHRFASSALDQFFSMAPEIQRYRIRETGRFDVDSIEIVQRLQSHFGRRQRLKMSYCIKLSIQLVVALAFVAFSAVYYTPDDFKSSFDCSIEKELICSWLIESWASFHCDRSLINTSSITSHYLDGKVMFTFPCTYTEALLLEPLWICSFIVLALAVIVSLYGLYWYKTPHWQQLDYEGKAVFLYSFCIRRGLPYKPMQKWIQEHTKIANDLDLLVMMLCRYDKGHGKTFYEIQVENRLEEMWSRDFESYGAFINDLVDTQSTGSRDDVSGVPDKVILVNYTTVSTRLGAKHRMSFIGSVVRFSYRICFTSKKKAQTRKPIRKVF